MWDLDQSEQDEGVLGEVPYKIRGAWWAVSERSFWNDCVHTCSKNRNLFAYASGHIEKRWFWTYSWYFYWAKADHSWGSYSNLVKAAWPQSLPPRFHWAPRGRWFVRRPANHLKPLKPGLFLFDRHLQRPSHEQRRKNNESSFNRTA